MTVPAALVGGVAAVLRGERVAWRALGVAPDAFLAWCAAEDLTGLVQRRLAAWPGCDWPRQVRDALTSDARAEAMREALRRQETVRALGALAARGVQPVLLKGTPLAYTAYAEPSLRPRSDTDLLIAPAQEDDVRRAMSGLGYAPTNYCENVFCQFELAKTDTFGVAHAFDFHWKISTQSAFADVLGYDEAAREAMPVPALGARARAAGPVHALLLACIHPAMHHRNAERLLWLHDIHLLVSMLSEADLHRFAALAAERGVRAVCAHELALARSRLGTEVPARVLAALAVSRGTAEPSAPYLEPKRHWSDEVMANVRGLPRWADRLRLLKEIVLPAPGYMLRAYGLDGRGAAGALLPALYVHRGVRGLWRVLRNRK